MSIKILNHKRSKLIIYFLASSAMLVLMSLLIGGCTLDKKIEYDVVVAQDGSGDYRTVTEAINTVPYSNKERIVIYIKNGTYKEKIRISKGKSFISLIGQSQDKTILTYDDYASKKGLDGQDLGTTNSASVFIDADDFTAEKLTFENSAGQVGQAVAVNITGDRHVYKNCRFIGLQDTLYTKGQGRLYFKDCYIKGNTDFIFGASTSVFEKCTIFTTKLGGYITAASTPQEKKYGYVFLDCTLKGDVGTAQTYLGRPWRPYASVVYINTHMDEHIKPEGWNNWSKAENEKTARYAEYNSKGQGANPDKRASWSKQLTDEEVKEYTVENVLKGTDNWDPKKPVY